LPKFKPEKIAEKNPEKIAAKKIKQYSAITVNGIKLNLIYQSQITLLNLVYASSLFAYCYLLVNAISSGFAKIDPNKQHLL
jgi:hypothetical protein